MHTHDIIIVGAGITGTAMALALAAQKWRVALIDKQPPLPIDDETHLRVSNINFTVEQYLNSLNVFFDQRRGLFKQIKVYQQDSQAELTVSSQLVGLPYLGSIIENNVLVNLIQTQLQQQPHLDCFWPVDIERLTFTETTAQVDTSQMQLRAPLIIGATGAQADLRQQCGILQDEKSYEQTALVVHIATQKPHNHTAYQRFLSFGPLAYLPLADPHHCSIVWSSSPQHIHDLMQLTDAALATEIAQGLSHCLGEVAVISKRATFPLVMRHAKHYIAPRVAFIGDAIHTLHPLAGQGANLGLMDVACLAKVLAFAKQTGRDIGTISMLRQYERERRLANTVMLQLIQVLAQNQGVFTFLRGMGLHVASHSNELKRWMLQAVLGRRLDSSS